MSNFLIVLFKLYSQFLFSIKNKHIHTFTFYHYITFTFTIYILLKINFFLYLIFRYLAIKPPIFYNLLFINHIIRVIVLKHINVFSQKVIVRHYNTTNFITHATHSNTRHYNECPCTKRIIGHILPAVHIKVLISCISITILSTLV